MADVYSLTATITSAFIRIKMAAIYAGTRETIATEARPASLAEADVFLAFHGFIRIRDWDLGEFGDVTAWLRTANNRFNGTVAARLWDAVGTTHEQWEVMPASKVENGDLISDRGMSAPYVVAGSEFEMGAMKVHMVGEGEEWSDRHTTDFPGSQLVQVARRKA